MTKVSDDFIIIMRYDEKDLIKAITEIV